MNFKIKILLHSLMRDVSRGIIKPEQAAAQFEKSTGKTLDEALDQADPQVGEFLALLLGAYKFPAAIVPEVDLAALPADFMATEISFEQVADLVQPVEDAPVDPEAEQPQETPKTDAPAVSVDQPKRTRQKAQKPA